MAEPIADQINAALEDIKRNGDQLRLITSEHDAIMAAPLSPVQRLEKLIPLQRRAKVIEQRSAELFETLDRLVADEYARAMGG